MICYETIRFIPLYLQNTFCGWWESLTTAISLRVYSTTTRSFAQVCGKSVSNYKCRLDVDELFTTLSLGFMKHLPNLLKQESSSAATLVHVLLRMYYDPRPEHQSARPQIAERLLPLVLLYICGFPILTSYSDWGWECCKIITSCESIRKLKILWRGRQWLPKYWRAFVDSMTKQWVRCCGCWTLLILVCEVLEVFTGYLSPGHRSTRPGYRPRNPTSIEVVLRSSRVRTGHYRAAMISLYPLFNV